MVLSKFGGPTKICQIAKFKSLPNKPCIQYYILATYFTTYVTYAILNRELKIWSRVTTIGWLYL